MRLHEREMQVSIAKTELAIRLNSYQWPRSEGEDIEKPSDKDIDDVEMLRLVTFEIRCILLDMNPRVERAETFSNLKDLILAFKIEQDDPRKEGEKIIALTDVELLQGLYSYCGTKLKYMLRHERHGDYDKPGGLE